jgi:hypothetical protein
MQPFATHKEPINSTRLTLARQDADQIQAELARAQLKFIQDQLTAHFMADVYPLLAPVVPGLPSSEIVAAEFGDTQIEILIANKGKGAGSILLHNTKKRDRADILLADKQGPEFAFCFTKKGDTPFTACEATSCYGTMTEFRSMIDDVAKGLQGQHADALQKSFATPAPVTA